MKLALCGYGRMGREVEQAVNAAGQHEIRAILCKQIGDVPEASELRGCDVVIDFTAGDVAAAHIGLYAQAGIDAVIGTTGWDTGDARILSQVEASGIGVIVGSNFSVGMQLFLQLVGVASRQFHRTGGYDVYGTETHHTGKADAPSGSAKTIARVIVGNFPTKTTTQFERAAGPALPHELHFSSVRGGHNPGRHEVVFDSVADEVRLTHSAHGRRGFADGAILAAEYIKGKQGLMMFEELFEPGGPYAQ